MIIANLQIVWGHREITYCLSLSLSQLQQRQQDFVDRSDAVDLRDHYVGQPFNYIDFSKMLYGEDAGGGGVASTGTRDSVRSRAVSHV